MTEYKARLTCEATEVGNLYYFAPLTRTPGPYKEQRHVDAIVDIASDGTFAGVELIDNMPPMEVNAFAGKAHTETDWGPDVGAEVLPPYTQPPTPASGEQMEVVGYGHKAQDGHIDALALVPVHGCREPLVTLDAAQKAIAAANERAERAERERDERLKFHVRSFSALNSRYLAAEALNITLSEALEELCSYSDAEYVPNNAFKKALAALPAKQGGHSDEA